MEPAIRSRAHIKHFTGETTSMSLTAQQLKEKKERRPDGRQKILIAIMMINHPKEEPAAPKKGSATPGRG